MGIALASFLISLLTSIFVIMFSKRNGFFIDSHESDKPQCTHDSPTPRAGGLGIFFASCLVIIYALLGWKFIFASLLAFASGIIEDFKGTLSPKLRLFIQLSAAIAGIVLFDALILDVGISLPFGIGLFFTLFAVVGATNAMNIIDGFNGLASGIALMVLGALAFVAHSVGDSELLTLCLVIFSATLGFFALNFPKGRIFLGDGGAYFLGFAIVQIAILLSQRHAEVSPWFVLAIMIYPVYEVLFSIYRRRFRGFSALYPDGLHLHSLIFKRLTRSNPKTSLFLWIFSAPFIIAPLFYPSDTLLLIITVFLFIVAYHLFYMRLVRFGRP